MLYDTLIIGAGPAGLTASIYASRYKRSNLVIGKMVGGTITWAGKVDNFPSQPGISGLELGQKMAAQVKSLGVEILAENVSGVKKEAEGEFRVTTDSGNEFQAKSLIVTTGTERKKLNIPGEYEYLGKGVSYCTTCDAPFFKDKTVVLVGGSNAACSGAIHLSHFAKKVYLVYRKFELRAEPVWVEEIKGNPKIEVIYDTNLVKIVGESGRVKEVEFDKPYNNKTILETDGVFVEIGGVPSAGFLKPLGVDFDENGYIRVNEKMETNIEGVFAAGDVTTKSLILPQAIIACAAGATAANSTFEFLKSK